MLMRRKELVTQLAVVLAAIAILLLIVGCGQKQTSVPPSSSGPSKTQAPSSSSSTPATSEKTVPAPATKKISMSFSSPSYAFMPGKVALEMGFFKEEGLEVDFYQMDPPTVMAALSNADIDYTLTFSTVVDGALKGMPFKIVGAISTKPQHYLIAKPEIKSVQDLNGKIMGVSSAGNTDQIAGEAVVEAMGGDPKGLQIMPLGNEATRVEVLKKGLVDVIAATPPWPIQLKNQGFNVLGGPPDIKAGSPLSAVSTTEKKIKENPEEVKKVLRAMVRALKFIQTNREETIKIMASWLGQEPATINASYDLLLPSFSTDGKAPDESYAIAIRQRKESIKAEKEIPVSQLVDWKLLEEAQKTLK